MLPNEIIHKILEYADNFRIMKIKMDNNNIKYIFENDKNVSNYIYSIIVSYSPNTYETIQLKIIDYLANEKTPIECIFSKIEKHYNSSLITYELFCNVIKIIIEYYNTYYLNDDYYYGGYWHDGEWYKYEEVLVI